MKIVFLMRHSEPFKEHMGINDVKEDLLFSNIKTPLSIAGERLAKEYSKKIDFFGIDEVWSSNYVRAMSTAKYFAYMNNLKVNITDKLGERIHGVNSWDELPSDFERHQLMHENYKIGYGESQKEVRERMLSFINSILNESKSKIILIVSHATAITFLLKTWCEINNEYKFNGKTFFDGSWGYCETFGLVFDDDNNLINIEKLKLEI